MQKFREAASVLLVRLAAPSKIASVYIVRRAEQLAVLGGFHAFIGGSVDRIDTELPLDGSYDDAVARAAALRELFEEAGVLATSGALPGAAEMAALRDATLSDPRVLRDELARHELRLAASQLVPLGHWLTPAFSPVRFHAIYYALPLPPGQEPLLWPGELVDGLWASPAEAIERHEAGEIFLTYPTLATLRLLVDTAGDLEAASELAQARPRAPLAGGEMAFGLHAVPCRSPTLPPATHTNTYILGGRDLVVVDPGSPYPEEQALLFGYLDQLLAKGGRLREIWLTHHHDDHVGGVAALQERYRVPVAAHRQAAVAAGLTVDRFLEEGDSLPLEVSAHASACWRVLYTPGHSPDHLCFHEPTRGLLLCGDLMAGTGTILIAPPLGDMRAYLEALARLLPLQLRFVFPAHGAPFAAVHDKVMGYIAHRLERERAILAELAGSPGRTPEELVPPIYTDVPPAAHPWAALNVRAHLIKLEAEGRVQEKQGRYWLVGPPVDIAAQP
jgi:endoribonuclease LACTB2